MSTLSILRWLRPPTFPERAKSRQSAIVWGLLWALLLSSLPILAILKTGTSFNTIMIGNIFVAGLLLLTRRGHLLIASIAAPSIILTVITFISIRSDGVHDVAVVGYLLVIAIAALLIGTRGLIAFTLLAVGAYGALGVAEMNGVLVNDFSYKTGSEDIIIFAAICTVFSLLLRITLQYLIDSLSLTEGNERALVERNAQLEASQAEIQRLNAGLEQRIAARTADLQAATDENEQLYNISRDVNGAQDYVELVDAVAKHLDHPEFGVTLSLYDTQDKLTARIISVVAQRAPGQTFAYPVDDDHYSAETIRQWLTIPEVLVIHDTAAPPPEMHSGMLDELRMRRAGSLTMAELRLNTRVLGYITLGLPYSHEFSRHDVRVMRAVADLAAAAVERMRLYSEQVSVAERLRDADEVKSRFMANMSHELRTPLNAILNFTRFVSSGMLGTINPEQLDALNKTISSGKHLLSLINDVLDVTKIESQMLTLFVETGVDLLPEIDAAASAGEALIGDKPVTLERRISPNLPMMTGDRRRLRQVLLNLISNAVKFTEDGTVTLSAQQDGDQLVISVTDTGSGIPPEEHDAIFEPFRQSKRGLIVGGGSGLGLAIARRLVEAHHGTLTVESALGAGATFTVRLPVDSSLLRAQMESAAVVP